MSKRTKVKNTPRRHTSPEPAECVKHTYVRHLRDYVPYSDVQGLVERVSEHSAPSAGAFKQDTGKVRLSLLQHSVLVGIATVREFGVKKYGALEGWREVPDPLRRYKDALDRHWGAIVHQGEENDAESGLSHAYHFACNALFLAWFLVNKRAVVEEYRKNSA